MAGSCQQSQSPCSLNEFKTVNSCNLMRKKREADAQMNYPMDPLGPGGIQPIAPLGPGGIQPIAPLGPGGIQPIGPLGPGGIQPINPLGPGGIQPIAPLGPGGIQPIDPLGPGGIQPQPINPLGPGGIQQPCGMVGLETKSWALSYYIIYLKPFESNSMKLRS